MKLTSCLIPFHLTFSRPFENIREHSETFQEGNQPLNTQQVLGQRRVQSVRETDIMPHPFPPRLLRADPRRNQNRLLFRVAMPLGRRAGPPPHTENLARNNCRLLSPTIPLKCVGPS